MTASTPSSGNRFSLTRVLFVLVPLILLGVIIWKSGMLFPDPTNPDVIAKLVGLDDPVTNRLNERFTDADENLVADTPANTNELIDPDTIIFSYVAVEEAEEYRVRWQPFVDHLAKVTGRPVEYGLWTTTDDQLKALRDGGLHVTGLNTGSVPVAVTQAGFVPVCKLPSEDGSGTYHMEFIVPADSRLFRPKDLYGHELVLTRPGSNSGYKAPLVLLWSDFELKPGRDFNFRTSGAHVNSIQGIAEGRFQAAAVAGDLLKRAVENGDINANQYRSIYTSESFPTACLGYAHSLSPDLAEKVREALATFDWAGTSMDGSIAPMGRTTFINANYKDDWALIRRIDDATGKKHSIKQ